MKGTYIEVQAYGDFCMLHTDSIWYTEEKRDVKSILRIFCSINGLDVDEINNMTSNMVDDTRDAFKKYLKKENFRQITTKSVCFSD